MQCVCPKSGRKIRFFWSVEVLFVAILFGVVMVWKWHTLPLRVYWAHSWRKAEGSSPDEFWQPCWTTLTVQPSHAWPGNEKQVHRWKKRIYRGAPKKRRPQPYFSSALSSTYTQCLSLWNTAMWNHLSYILCLSLSWHATREHRMMPHILVFFLLEVIGLITKREELPVSCCLLLYTCFGYITFCLIHAICSLISTAWGTVVLQSLNDPS